MITFKLLLPNATDLIRLRDLACPLQIYEQADDASNSSILFSPDRNDQNGISLSIEFQDIEFKLEIFNLVPEVARLPEESELREAAAATASAFADWDAIRCVIACAWLRPAREGEVAPAFEQIVGERGLRSTMPADATAVGISMVGIIFHDSSSDQPAAMIYSDDSDPSALSVSRDPQQILNFAAEREVVAIEDFTRWRRDLLQWCSSLNA